MISEAPIAGGSWDARSPMTPETGGSASRANASPVNDRWRPRSGAAEPSSTGPPSGHSSKGGFGTPTNLVRQARPAPVDRPGPRVVDAVDGADHNVD